MKELYNSYYQQIQYEESEHLMVNTWKKESAELTDAQYLTEIHSLFMHQRKVMPTKMLYDTRDMEYQMSPDTQIFVAHLFKDIHAQFLAIVTLYRTGIDTSILHTVEELAEIAPTGFKVRYFAERALAMQWLLESKVE